MGFSISDMLGLASDIKDSPVGEGMESLEDIMEDVVAGAEATAEFIEGLAEPFKQEDIPLDDLTALGAGAGAAGALQMEALRAEQAKLKRQSMAESLLGTGSGGVLGGFTVLQRPQRGVNKITSFA